MSTESDVFGFEKIFPAAAKAVFAARVPDLVAYTVSDPLPLQRERPRIEFDFVAGAGQGRIMTVAVTNMAGDLVNVDIELAYKGTFFLDVVTAADILIHNEMLSKVRAQMGKLPAFINGCPGMERHSFGPFVRDTGTSPRWSPQDGVFQSRMGYEIDFSLQTDAVSGLT